MVLTCLAACACGWAGEELVPSPTLGGKQFWGDEQFFHQWRIQRNVLTGHYRLLDPHDVRHASGTLLDCCDALEKIKLQEKLPPMTGKAVIVLHGLGRTRSAMEHMAAYLRDSGGYLVLNVSYPSTRQEVSRHAEALASIVRNLDGVTEINFVAHSLGNIVVRHYLGDLATAGKPDPRLRRFVMLGPPNRGSILAAVLADNGMFSMVAGPSALQLGRDWTVLESKLTTAPTEFAIIAGGKQNEKGFNPLLPGDNDGVVTVAGTRLSGACDFAVVPVLHSFLMDDLRVQQATLRFLQQGCFVSSAQRHPIP